jgi:hypothetical protein
MLAYLARPEVIDSLRASEQHDDRQLSTLRGSAGHRTGAT